MQERIPFGKCPLCESPELADSAKGDVSGHPLYHASLNRLVQWKRCAACGHVFTEGYFSDEALQLIFSRTHEHQQAGFDLEQQRYVSARIVEKVLPYVNSGTWLDVGFGNGSLLFTAQEYGFTPLGLDLRAANVKAFSALGIEAHCKDLSDLSLDAACSVISMADVLEHAPYPKKTLQAARRLLSAGGVLFVSLPNMESMLWKTMDQRRANPYWAEIEHYHNFSRSRLYALLRETGFEPVRYGISERYRACMEVIARKA
jgi:SAM-dependent methyltransferase